MQRARPAHPPHYFRYGNVCKLCCHPEQVRGTASPLYKTATRWRNTPSAVVAYLRLLADPKPEDQQLWQAARSSETETCRDEGDTDLRATVNRPYGKATAMPGQRSFPITQPTPIRSMNADNGARARR